MKTLLIIGLLLIAGTFNMPAQQIPKDALNSVKQLLAATEQKMKAQGADFPEAVAENVSMLRKIPEYGMLEKEADSFWKVATLNLSVVAPTETSKMIFVRACQSMTPGNYVKFLNEMASLYDEHRISKTVLTVALYPEGRLNHVLDDNYQNQDVVAFTQHAKHIWADDPQMVQMFNAISSGESKRGIDAMRKGGGETSTEVKIGPSAQGSPAETGTASQ